jgi:hypothetical protein
LGLKPATNRLKYVTAKILWEYSGVWVWSPDCLSENEDQQLATLSTMMALMVS